MAIIFKLTNAGRAALVNAQNNGTLARTVVSVGVTATAFTPLATLTAIPNEIKRIETISGDVVDPDTVHVTVRDDGNATYTVRGLGLWLDNGVLLGTYSQAAVIVEKSPAGIMLLALDVRVLDGSVDISTLVFGNKDFLNPPATTERQGVVELATAAEAAAMTDATRALTPASVAAPFAARALVATAINAGTGLTGGGSLGASRTIALANTAVAAGSYGSATAVPTFTVNAQGQLVAAAAVAVAPPWGSITAKPTTLAGYGITDAALAARTLTAGTGLTGGGDLTANRTFALANTAVAAGNYGSATTAVVFTVDAQGRLTAANSVTITPAWGSVTGKPTTLAGYAITDAALAARKVTAGTGLTGGGDLTADRTIALSNTAVAPGSYGNATSVPTFTVNAQGQLVAASAVAIPAATQSAAGLLPAADKATLDGLPAVLDTFPTKAGAGAAGTWPISVNGSSVAVRVLDTRAVNDTPAQLQPYAITSAFKQVASVANPPVTSSQGAYAHVINVAGYDVSGGSGGWPSQISVGPQGLATRTATNAAAWGAWTKMAAEGSSPTFAAVTAVTFTGALKGNADTATNATSAAKIGGIDFKNGDATTPSANPDAQQVNGISYVRETVSILGAADGALYSQGYSASWVHQIYGDYRTGQVAVRGKNNNAWQPWRTLLDSANFNTWAPTKTGGGASGSWAVNAATATKLETPRRINRTLFDGSADIAVQWASEAIPASADLNNYRTEGVYHCAATATAATLANCPAQMAFGMRVMQASGFIQEVIEYPVAAARMWRRNYYSGGWGAWYRVYSEADPQPNVAGNAGTATRLAVARNLSLTGAATGASTAFDGTAPIAIPVTAINLEHAGMAGLLGSDHGGVPPATLIHFAGPNIPPGYLRANGAAVSRTTYAALFAALGTYYGGGDGSTTFNLPDARAMFLRGLDEGRGVDPGRFLGTIQGSQNLWHQHSGATDAAGWHAHSGTTNWDGEHRHNTQKDTGNSGNPGEGMVTAWGWEGYVPTTTAEGAHAHGFVTDGNGTHGHTFNTSWNGGDEARPINLSTHILIKF